LVLLVVPAGGSAGSAVELAAPVARAAGLRDVSGTREMVSRTLAPFAAKYQHRRPVVRSRR
jgi:hypothetical protein